MAKVSPIFKNGSKSHLNNYRPLSVIPTVAKIFEKIIYDQLYQHLNENGLLNSGQSGFRSLHSTLKYGVDQDVLKLTVCKDVT